MRKSKKVKKQCSVCKQHFLSYKCRFKKFCSNKCRGDARKGIRISPKTEFKEKPKVGYRGLHSWLVRKYGYPPKCEKCGRKGKRVVHWNIQYALKKRYKYKKNIKHFLRLYVSCHKKYDRK